MPTLYDPLTAGSLALRNRVVMAPLTRARAGDSRLPNDLMADYYRQRAGAGLILTEATSIMPMGVGYAGTPGIWSDAQTAAWRRVTEAVHAEGGLIVMQLWHVGRISDPMFLNGELPVAPSAIAPSGHVRRVRPQKPYVTPRALRLDEIPEIVAAYRKGAANAKAAGFDGVELHGANGYLLDQFLEDGTNRRTDAYGGAVENRARLMFEAVDAAVEVWGAGRVGLHLSPRGESHDMRDSDPAATFLYVAAEAKRRNLAFLFLREHLGPGRLLPRIARVFGGPVIANEGFSREEAQAIVASGEAAAVAFGVKFIANPDLPVRLMRGAPLNPPREDLFYGDGAEGYTDYPALPA